MCKFQIRSNWLSCTRKSWYWCSNLQTLCNSLYLTRMCCMPVGCNLSTELYHYNDVIMSAVASEIKILPIVYSTVDLGTDERKHQSSAPLAFVRWIHRWPVNSPHKGPVTRKMFPSDDAIITLVVWIMEPVSTCIIELRDWVFINSHYCLSPARR